MTQIKDIALPPYLKQHGLQARHVRVIGIGAGASGLLLAYKLQRNFENFDLKIFEKNEGAFRGFPLPSETV